MHFIDDLTARFLVQAVNILCDNAVELALCFHFRKLYVGPVGMAVPCVHLLPVELKKDLGLMVQAAAAEQVFRLVAVKAHVMLVVEAVLTSEIGDAALRRYACAAKKRDVLRTVDDLAQRLIFFLSLERAQIRGFLPSVRKLSQMLHTHSLFRLPRLHDRALPRALNMRR